MGRISRHFAAGVLVDQGQTQADCYHPAQGTAYSRPRKPPHPDPDDGGGGGAVDDPLRGLHLQPVGGRLPRRRPLGVGVRRGAVDPPGEGTAHPRPSGPHRRLRRHPTDGRPAGALLPGALPERVRPDRDAVSVGGGREAGDDLRRGLRAAEGGQLGPRRRPVRRRRRHSHRVRPERPRRTDTGHRPGLLGADREARRLLDMPTGRMGCNSQGCSQRTRSPIHVDSDGARSDFWFRNFVENTRRILLGRKHGGRSPCWQ